MKILEQIRTLANTVNKVRPLKGWNGFFLYITIETEGFSYSS